MPHAAVPHVAFPLSEALKSKSNRFLESIAANDKRAGELYYEVIIQLSDEVLDALLMQTLANANLSPVAMKVVNMCATTCSKASSMLSAKIYKGAKLAEMQKVASFWQGLMKSDQPGHDANWYLASPIDSQLATALDKLLEEKGEREDFVPSDIEDMANKYDQLMNVIIDQFFLGPAAFVDMGMVTRKMLNLGVEGVRQASHAVIHKVVKKLEPVPLGAYVNHTAQYYLKF
ncbi:MAG: hypothetical protein R3F38_00845 [Gammaproteobacteria bacterium]